MTDSPPLLVQLTLDDSVPDWLIEYPQTEIVFKHFGIDTSCGGKSLHYLCDYLWLDPQGIHFLLMSMIDYG